MKLLPPSSKAFFASFWCWGKRKEKIRGRTEINWTIKYVVVLIRTSVWIYFLLKYRIYLSLPWQAALCVSPQLWTGSISNLARTSVQSYLFPAPLANSGAGYVDWNISIRSQRSFFLEYKQGSGGVLFFDRIRHRLRIPVADPGPVLVLEKSRKFSPVLHDISMLMFFSL